MTSEIILAYTVLNFLIAAYTIDFTDPGYYNISFINPTYTISFNV